MNRVTRPDRIALRGGVARRLVVGALVAVACAAVAPRASTQPCFGPDNLVGGCCQVVTPTLPAFTGVQLPGLGICWANCQPAQKSDLRVDWPAPALLSCTSYATPLTVWDANTALPVMTGTMILDYTRTWQEIDPNGSIYQVWRFAAKVDLSPALVGVVPICPTPPCLQPFGSQPSAFFYGYVDYAQRCGGPVFENAIVLQHGCDFFIHRPGLSSQPGVFHPKESFAIVAPVSSAQPFTIGSGPPSSGPLLGEGVRATPPILPSICYATDFVTNGQMGLLGGACLCPLGPVPKQHWFRTFQGQLSCPDATGVPGSFLALNIGFPNLLPWYGLTSTAIGAWTNPNLYPGQERAWVDEGLFLQNDACNGQYISIQYGGSTRFGWSILHPVLFSGMTDLASNYFAPVGGPYPFPLFGNIAPTDGLIYVNSQ